ncbi:MAG: caspase domain-containing protein [Planctomycetota bacterium]
MVAGLFVLRGSLSSAGKEVDPNSDAFTLRGIAPKSSSAPTAYSGTYTKSRALLIGIGEAYGDIGFQPLPNAERDVDALAKKLGELEGEDWEIVTLKGAQAKNAAICSRVREMSRSAKRDDKLFVYYAGHGAKHPISDRSGWIVPADAKSAAEDPDHVSWVRFDEFSRVFDESEAKHVLVAMDCCYGGRLTTWRGEESSTAGSDRREAYGEALLTRGAQVVISSGRPFEAVSDGVSGENSPFVRSFLEALSESGGAPVTGHEIFSRITKTFIEEEVGHIPVLGSPPGSTPGGDVVFFPK